MSNTELTAKQQETFNAIQNFIETRNYSPTVSELKLLLSVSSNQAVLNHLDALQDKGYITREKRARGIMIKKHSFAGSGENEFLNILSRISENKKGHSKNSKVRASYSNPYIMDENSGKVIFGRIDNEQY